jgi:hypothetical protein
MTIAISLKVNNGIVLATDSAATIFAQTPDGNTMGVVNVYQNAEKLFNLCKTQPIGVVTWGSGAIGKASISSLLRDFRKILTIKLNQNENFKIEEITKEFSSFIFDTYEKAFGTWQRKPNIGFIVAGYSSGQDFAEEWIFEIINGNLSGPRLVRKQDEIGMIWNGEIEAINRLLLGYSIGLSSVLKEADLNDQQINHIVELAREKLAIPFVVDAMPIQDAIDLAEFFVETTINYSKFSPGAPTVGGPIDIAAITKHEGFKWVKRKYYYDSTLNPDIVKG